MDVTFLERMSIAAIIAVGLGMLFVMRIVKGAILQVVALVILFGLVLGIWLYRGDLDECRRTCSCSLLGLDVDFSDSAQRQCDFVTNR